MTAGLTARRVLMETTKSLGRYLTVLAVLWGAGSLFAAPAHGGDCDETCPYDTSALTDCVDVLDGIKCEYDAPHFYFSGGGSC
jgi:hypothetical protein